MRRFLVVIIVCITFVSCYKMDTLEIMSNLNSLQRKNDSLLSVSLKLQKTIDSVQMQVKLSNVLLNSIDGKLSGLQSSIGIIVTDISLLTKKIDSVNVNSADIKKGILSLNSQFQGLASQINLVFNSISNKLDTLNSLSSTNTNLLYAMQSDYLKTRIKVDSILLIVLENNRLLLTNNNNSSQVQDYLMIITTQYTNILSLLNQLISSCSTTPCLDSKLSIGVLYLPGTADFVACDSSKWHYVVLTKSALNGKLYFDGKLMVDSTFLSNPYIWNSLLLGATQACVTCSPTPNFDGVLDEVKLSSGIKPKDSIITYFNSPRPLTADANTLGLFHFENNSSKILLNSSVGNNGVLYGAPSYVPGKFGSGMKFSKVNGDYSRFTKSIPVDNITLEFWFNSSDTSATLAQFEYAYNMSIYLFKK